MYFTKTGELPPWEGNELTHWGTLIEPVVLDDLIARERIPGVRRLKPHTVVRRFNSIHFATPDAIQVAAEDFQQTPKIRPIDVKNVNAYAGDEWGRDGEPNGVPPYVLTQSLWQQRAMGADMGWIAALHGGNDLRIYPIPYDAERGAELWELAIGWWMRHIPPRDPPPYRLAEHVKIEQTGSGQLPLTNELENVIRQRKRAAETEKIAAKDKDQCDIAIKTAMGAEHDIIVGRDGKTLATWRTAKSGRRTFRCPGGTL